MIRSSAAFGAHGVVVPQRRSAGMTATAWRTSAGAAARIPIAKATNLTRALREAQDAGILVIGLDADGEVDVFDLPAAVDPLMIVVGSEGAACHGWWEKPVTFECASPSPTRSSR